MQEELIKVEKEEEEKEEKELARMKESKARKEDVALKEMTIPTVREAQEQAIARALEKRDQLYEISCALAVLASASSVSREREEFLGLVNKEVFPTCIWFTSYTLQKSCSIYQHKQIENPKQAEEKKK
nr:unnamed protein product [Gossypium raimondii]XP_012463894.1 unnamed protein product [Gossypium raimondii]